MKKEIKQNKKRKEREKGVRKNGEEREGVRERRARQNAPSDSLCGSRQASANEQSYKLITKTGREESEQEEDAETDMISLLAQIKNERVCAAQILRHHLGLGSFYLYLQQKGCNYQNSSEGLCLYMCG